MPSRIPAGYPEANLGDLVQVPGSAPGKMVQRRMLRPLMALQQAAADAGFPAPLFTITSGYRTQARQDELFRDAVAKYGSEAEARKWVAKVSSHRTGYTVDFDLGISNSSGNAKSGAFTALPQWQWLAANAARFGFAPYEREPWHWEWNPDDQGGSLISGVDAVSGAATAAGSAIKRALASPRVRRVGLAVAIGGVVYGVSRLWQRV